MAYPEKIRNAYQEQIKNIQTAGLFKQERFIHSPQAALQMLHTLLVQSLPVRR